MGYGLSRDDEFVEGNGLIPCGRPLLRASTEEGTEKKAADGEVLHIIRALHPSVPSGFLPPVFVLPPARPGILPALTKSKSPPTVTKATSNGTR